VRDGATVVIGGSGAGHALPQRFIDELAAVYEAEGRPRDLTTVRVVGIGDFADRGFSQLGLPGLMRRTIGSNIGNEPRLGALVKRILRDVPELVRLRLSSIDSVEADSDLLDALANERRLMPHLHLSLQSGDDLILKRMKRRHARRDAISFCERVRRLRPDVVFGADIIAGFPTETEAMFAHSLDLVDECGLTQLHVFPFSLRPGTPAARSRSSAAISSKRSRPSSTRSPPE